MIAFVSECTRLVLFDFVFLELIFLLISYIVSRTL